MGFGSRLHQLFNNGQRDPEIRFFSVPPPDANILTPIRYSVKSRKAAWVAGSLVGFFLTSALVAGITVRMGEDGGGATEFRQFYITDAAAALDELRVTVSRVEVCDGQPLSLVRGQFDLLSLRGTENALLVAEGYARPCGDPTVSVEFREVIGCLQGRCAALRMEQDLLKVQPQSTLGGTVLVDIDVDASVESDPLAALANLPAASFTPEVKAVYTKDPASAYTAWQEATFAAQASLAQDEAEEEPEPIAHPASGDAGDTAAGEVPVPTPGVPASVSAGASVPNPSLPSAGAGSTASPSPSSTPTAPTSPSTSPTSAPPNPTLAKGTTNCLLLC